MRRPLNLETCLRWLFLVVGWVLILQFYLGRFTLFDFKGIATAFYPQDVTKRNHLIGSLLLILLLAGALCLLTASGLKRHHPWGWWMSMVLSTLLLFGFPWLTPVGALGVFLSIKTPRKHDRPHQAFWDPKRQSLLTIIAALIGFELVLVGFGVFVNYAGRMGLPEPAFQPNVWLMCVGLLAMHSVFHECGHALTAWAVGQHVKEVCVGPIILRKGNRGYRFAFDLRRLLSDNGYMRAVPASAKGIRLREIVVIAAGPLTSFGAGLAFMAVFVLSVETPWESYWNIIAMASLLGFLVFAVNLVPSGYTDGAMLVHLIFNTQRGKELIAAVLAGTAMDQAADDAGGLLVLQREMLKRVLEGGSNNPVDLAATHMQVGLAELEAGYHRAAETNFRSSLDVLARGKTNPVVEAECWSGLHRIYVFEHRKPEVAQAYAEALRLLQSFPKKASGLMFRTLLMLGELHSRARAFAPAVDAAVGALGCLPDAPEYSLLRGSLLRLRAHCEFQLGHPEPALTAANEAAVILRSPGEAETKRPTLAGRIWAGEPNGLGFVKASRRGRLEELGHVGEALWLGGRIDEAAALLTECVRLLEECELSHSAAAARLTLSAVLQHAGRLSEAERALPDPARLNQCGIRQFLKLDGAIHQEGGRIEEAIVDYQEALRLTETGPEAGEIEIAKAKSLLAEAHMDAGNAVVAGPLANEAYRTLSATEHPDSARACITLALIAQRAGESTSDWFEKAITTIEQDPLLPRACKARFLKAAADRLEKAGLTAEANRCRVAAGNHSRYLGPIQPTVENASV